MLHGHRQLYHPIIHIKTEDVLQDIINGVEERFDTSNYEFRRPFSTAYREKKVIGLMNDELGGQIMAEFIKLRPETYSYLMDNGNSDKKAKATKNT